MHEFSICENIIRSAVSELGKVNPPAKKLTKVTVVVGAMHQIVPENLHFAFEVLTRDTLAAGAKLELKPVPITARCLDCGWEGEIRQPLFLCGSCNSGEIELLTGKELYLANLEIEQDDDDEH